MKLNVERDALHAALSHATRVVERAREILIFSTVVLSASGDAIAVTASNLQLSVRTRAAADILEEGDAAVPLQALFQLLQRLPAGTAMQFEHDAEKRLLVAKYRRSQATLPTLEPDAYVVLSPPDNGTTFELPAGVLVRLLATPSHIPAAEAAHRYATGIHLHYRADGDKVVGIASDGLRMTLASLPASEVMRTMPAITVPVKAAEEIVRLARGAPDEVLRLSASPQVLSVDSAGAQLTTRLVDEVFPDYRRALPSDFGAAFAIPGGELLAALQRALVLIEDKDRTVNFEVADDVLTIQSRNNNGAAIDERVEVEGGNGITFSVNATKMAESLAAVDAEVIEIAVSAPGAPIVLQKRGGGDVLSLIMPLRG